MCICAAPANLNNTKLYVGEGKMDGRYVHVLAYQNNADSQNRWEANAMILPFPTKVAMGRGNIIDTSSFSGFLKDITDACKMQTKTLGTRRGMTLGCAGGFDVFESGSYTVILADDIKKVWEAMLQVPEEKRINLSYRFVLGFSKLYPDQPVAVCLWKGSIKPEPLLWWYEPKDKSTLFIPTMDAHDGGAPDLNALVETDHIITVGSNLLADSRRYNRVHYKGAIPKDIKSLLPDYVYGSEVRSHIKNGDMFVKVSELTMGEKVSVPNLKRGSSWEDSFNEFPMWGWVG